MLTPFLIILYLWHLPISCCSLLTKYRFITGVLHLSRFRCLDRNPSKRTCTTKQLFQSSMRFWRASTAPSLLMDKQELEKRTPWKVQGGRPRQVFISNDYVGFWSTWWHWFSKKIVGPSCGGWFVFTLHHTIFQPNRFHENFSLKFEIVLLSFLL